MEEPSSSVIRDDITSLMSSLNAKSSTPPVLYVPFIKTGGRPSCQIGVMDCIGYRVSGQIRNGARINEQPYV